MALLLEPGGREAHRRQTRALPQTTGATHAQLELEHRRLKQLAARARFGPYSTRAAGAGGTKPRARGPAPRPRPRAQAALPVVEVVHPRRDGVPTFPVWQDARALEGAIRRGRRDRCPREELRDRGHRRQKYRLRVRRARREGARAGELVAAGRDSVDFGRWASGEIPRSVLLRSRGAADGPARTHPRHPDALDRLLTLSHHLPTRPAAPLCWTHRCSARTRRPRS